VVEGEAMEAAGGLDWAKEEEEGTEGVEEVREEEPEGVAEVREEEPEGVAMEEEPEAEEGRDPEEGVAAVAGEANLGEEDPEGGDWAENLGDGFPEFPPEFRSDTCGSFGTSAEIFDISPTDSVELVGEGVSKGFVLEIVPEGVSKGFVLEFVPGFVPGIVPGFVPGVGPGFVPALGDVFEALRRGLLLFRGEVGGERWLCLATPRDLGEERGDSAREAGLGEEGGEAVVGGRERGGSPVFKGEDGEGEGEGEIDSVDEGPSTEARKELEGSGEAEMGDRDWEGEREARGEAGAGDWEERGEA
jgi:hypothetical protein